MEDGPRGEVNCVITTIPPALGDHETEILNALQTLTQGTKPNDPTQVRRASPVGVSSLELLASGADCPAT